MNLKKHLGFIQAKSSVPFIFSLLLSTVCLAQSLTLDTKNKSLIEVLEQIKKQTNYEVFADLELVNSPLSVDIHAKNMTLKKFLDAFSKQTSIGYRIVDQTIMLEHPAKSKSNDLKNRNQSLVSIAGTVSSSAGGPQEGVTISVNGKKSTTTDHLGRFELENIPANAELRLSGIMINSISIQIEGGTRAYVMNANGDKYREIHDLSNMQIEVATGQNILDEINVVSTGYQRIKREHLTGAAVTMDNKQFENRVTTGSLLDGLQNKMPGLMYNDGLQFDGAGIFQIRGLSTMTASARQPLIVLDGYPTELNIEDINPNEIESVTLLKDAAAASIYGVRSANGVLVIERKKARIGEPNFNFRAVSSMRPKTDYKKYRYADPSVRKKYLLTNFDEFGAYGSNIDYYRAADRRVVPGTEPFILFNSGLIDRNQMLQQLDSIFSYNNSDEYSDLFERTAVTQQYSLNFNGGSEKFDYFLSALYNKQNLVKKDNDHSSFNFSSRLNFRLSKRFTARLLTDIIIDNTRTPSISSYESFNRYTRFADDDGTPLPFRSDTYFSAYYNETLQSKGYLDHAYYPAQEMKERMGKLQGSTNKIFGELQYKLTEDLSLTGGGIYEMYKGHSSDYRTINSFYVRNLINYFSSPVSATSVESGLPMGGMLISNESKMTSLTGRLQANFNKTWNSAHTLNVIAGGEIRRIMNTNSRYTYFAYDDQTLLHQPADLASTIGNEFWWNPNVNIYAPSFDQFFSDQYEENRFVSLYSNAVYSYDNRYILSGSLRVDQSDLFGTERSNRYKPFWSAGAAWNMHNEGFLKDVEAIDFMKLRVSYGLNGNIPKTSLPRVIAKYQNNGNLWPDVQTSLDISQLANQAITWERTKSLNVGYEISLYDRYNLVLDYYGKRSDYILAESELDPTKGGTSAVLNAAKMKNDGFEIAIKADMIRSAKWRWESNLSLTYNKGMVQKVYVSESKRSWSYFQNDRYIVGHPAGPVFAYRDAGLSDKGLPLIYAHDTGEKKSVQYDFNTDTYINDSGLDDLEYLGTSIPPVFIGFYNRIDYKNVYLYFMFDLNTGFKTRIPRPKGYILNPIEGSENFFIKAGDEAKTDVMGFAPDGIWDFDGIIYDGSNKYVVDGSYLLLRDLTLAYKLKSSVLKKLKMSNLEIKAQGTNLFAKGFNKYNYSPALGSFLANQIIPTYTLAIFANF